MNTKILKRLFLVALACSVTSSASEMMLRYRYAGYQGYSTYKANLMEVYSINFMKEQPDEEGDSLMLKVKGTKPLKDLEENDMYEMPLELFKDIKFNEIGKDETMTIAVKSLGSMGGKYTFNISDIQSVDVVNMYLSNDTDKDGISDVEEMFIYGTDPYSDDTDGDSWKDNEEIGYSSWNPKVANLPSLEVKLVGAPEIYLKKSKTTGSSDTYTVATGSTQEVMHSNAYNETRSSELMDGWDVGVEIGTTGGHFHAVGHANYSGSVTESQGYGWTSSTQESLAKKYEEARATARSENVTINGAKLCVNVSLSNTGAIAYTINSLTLSVSANLLHKGTSTISTQNAVNKLSPISLTPGQSSSVSFCDENLSVSQVEDVLYNPGVLFLSATDYTITLQKDGSGANDFTGAYTNTFAKTASVIIDYGPRLRKTAGKNLKEFRVATNYLVKTANGMTADRYVPVSVADLLKSLKIKYEEDSLVNPAGKKVYALKSLDGVSYSAKSGDTSAWFLGITRASNPQYTTLYSLYIGSVMLDTLFVDAGDFVQFIYNEDLDHDGVPASTEDLQGTNDNNVDSDGDGISDYDEIKGWKRGSEGPFYTNPARKDTDGDGIDDKDDPEPTVRKLYTSTVIDTLYVYDVSKKKYIMVKPGCKSGSCDSTNFEWPDMVYEGTFAVRVKTKEPVARVTVKRGDSVCVVTQKDDYFEFSSAQSKCGTLSPATKDNPFNKFAITVTSEDEKSSLSHTLNIKSSLAPPKGLELSRNSEHSAIVLNFEKSSDARVSGYVVLRATNDYSNLARKEIDELSYKPIADKYLDGGIMMLGVIDSTKDSYTDNVGGGSPYYDYKVLAYTKVGNKYVFSKGTDTKEKAVGLIKVKFQMTGHGSEYWYKGVRLDATIQAWLHADQSGKWSQAHYYRAWFYNAGRSAHGDEIVYEDNSDSDGDNDAVPVDKTVYTVKMGSGGFQLQLKARYDGGLYTSDAAQHSIFWPYENFAKVLNNKWSGTPNAKNNSVPPNGSEVTFNWGMSGVEYNPSNNGCDGDCGDEPHGGLKFKFSYEWDD